MKVFHRESLVPLAPFMTRLRLALKKYTEERKSGRTQYDKAKVSS